MVAKSFDSTVGQLEHEKNSMLWQYKLNFISFSVLSALLDKTLGYFASQNILIFSSGRLELVVKVEVYVCGLGSDFLVEFGLYLSL